jgi:histidine triad (HIT) family protein
MPSIFSKIVSGEIPCYKIAETENCLAFLDVFPLVEGHVLVIPKKETDYIFDLSEEEFSELNLFAKKVAGAVRNAIPCKRVGIAVIGLEVPHAHIHLVPLNTIEDINFTRTKLKPSAAELEKVAARIRSAF